MKTVIYSLYQRHELQKLRCFIAQVLPALSHTRQLYILINDEDCPDLRTHTDAASPHIVVHCAGGNLGVAGGRNFLIRRALEAGAEFLISCDTDIIYENGYFDRLSDAYRRIAKTDPLVSFIQPILLDGRKVRRFFSALHKAGNWDDVRAGLGENAPAWRDSLWNTVKEKAGPEKALLSIYHSGVSNIWSAHFGAPPDERMPRPWLRPQWGKVFGTRHATVRSDFPLMERIIANGIPVRIASTAGGISAFHKSVFEAVGDYDEIFNPFGYEDSEMGFRSNLTGRHNYLIPNIFAIHDVFMGETNRSLMSFARLGLLRGVELTHPNLLGRTSTLPFSRVRCFAGAN